MTKLDLPTRFIEIITCAFGEAGRKWLRDLPELVTEVEREWQISVGGRYANLSYHYVAPCVCSDGGGAVLKMAFPGDPNPTIFNEAEMLKLNGGSGMAGLLRFDAGRRALLIERLMPGDHLKTLFEKDKTTAVPIAAGLMKRIWRDPPAEHKFPKLEDWFYGGFDAARTAGFAPEHIAKATSIFDELNSKTEKRLLLHGDLHHWNILSARREPYLIIDPKGIVGNPGYEMSTFLINHANWLENPADRRKELAAAIGEFSRAFDIKPEIIRKWTFCQSILSAWWTFEEGSLNWTKEIDRSEIWEV